MDLVSSPRVVHARSQDFEVFMQELEEDSDLRSQIRLYKGKQMVVATLLLKTTAGLEKN